MRHSLKLLPLALMLILASCASNQAIHLTQTPQATGAIKSIPCADAPDIELSHDDTAFTKVQVLKYNTVRDDVCN